jgi:hypothetical protein
VRVAPKNNAACLSAANIYSNPHENNTFSSEKVCLQTKFFQSLRPLLQLCANEKQVRVCPVGTISCPTHVAKFSQH